MEKPGAQGAGRTCLSRSELAGKHGRMVLKGGHVNLWGQWDWDFAFTGASEGLCLRPFVVGFPLQPQASLTPA